MQTNVDGVFAGGDVAMFPFPLRNNKKVNIPHWQMAHVHGECATASGCRLKGGVHCNVLKDELVSLSYVHVG